MNNDQSNDTLKGRINASLLESPPAGFTSSVMNRLPAPSFTIQYKPVISPLGWLVVGILAFLLFLMGLSGNGGSPRFRLPEMPLLQFPEFSFESLFSGSALPLILLVALAGLFYAAADTTIRKWRTA
jgi:hypothetical protein